MKMRRIIRAMERPKDQNADVIKGKLTIKEKSLATYKDLFFKS